MTTPSPPFRMLWFGRKNSKSKQSVPPVRRPEVVSRQGLESPTFTSELTDHEEETRTFRTNAIAEADVLHDQSVSVQQSDSEPSKKGLLGHALGLGRGGRREASIPTVVEEDHRLTYHTSQSKKLSFFSRHSNESSDTLVGSGLMRKEMDEGIHNPSGVVHTKKLDTKERLEDLRRLMEKDNLDFYIIPSEDAHGSEYVAACDKRREWMSGFTGSAGQAVISRRDAYLITDSRYWLQAEEQVDEADWYVIRAGEPPDGPKDWIDWLVDRASNNRIGINPHMLSHNEAMQLNTALGPKNSKLVCPAQNLVDLIWKNKPTRSKGPIYVQPNEYTGMDAYEKIKAVRLWITEQQHIGTLLTSLPSIAYVLNLRGDDIPFNPLFQSYLYIGLNKVVLFLDSAKIEDPIRSYLEALEVEQYKYNDIWTFLRKREYGDGKVLINPQTSYAISLMLTHMRYTVAPSFVDEMKAVKNETELEGLRHAYARDGAAFVRWLAWLEERMNSGYNISEWEAGFRLTEYRRNNKHFMGLAYENISATGPNAALPHYVPTKDTARDIERDTPYINDSGGQYRDGTCDTTRTMHFGHPSAEQCEAYTRVLQGHIAIDSAVFPEGTTGLQLDVLARKALWQDGLNYLHGTGHGFGSFLTVHEGPHSFSSNHPLQPGYVITNGPGFYNIGQWGIRIKSALAVCRVRTKREFGGDTWLGFERLTCVPIQTKIVKEDLLSKNEKSWLKDHNRHCFEKLEPYIREDKRALKWLRREAERGIQT